MNKDEEWGCECSECSQALEGTNHNEPREEWCRCKEISGGWLADECPRHKAEIVAGFQGLRRPSEDHKPHIPGGGSGQTITVLPIEDWEERTREYMKKFLKPRQKDAIDGLDQEIVIDYFRNTLADARTAALDEVIATSEKYRMEPTLCGKCNLNGALCRNCYANRRANNMLDSILRTITELRDAK